MYTPLKKNIRRVKCITCKKECHYNTSESAYTVFSSNKLFIIPYKFIIHQSNITVFKNL